MKTSLCSFMIVTRLADLEVRVCCSHHGLMASEGFLCRRRSQPSQTEFFTDNFLIFALRPGDRSARWLRFVALAGSDAHCNRCCRTWRTLAWCAPSCRGCRAVEDCFAAGLSKPEGWRLGWRRAQPRGMGFFPSPRTCPGGARAWPLVRSARCCPLAVD